MYSVMIQYYSQVDFDGQVMKVVVLNKSDLNGRKSSGKKQNKGGLLEAEF